MDINIEGLLKSDGYKELVSYLSIELESGMIGKARYHLWLSRIVNRLKHYSYRTKIPAEEIFDVWLKNYRISKIVRKVGTIFPRIPKGISAEYILTIVNVYGYGSSKTKEELNRYNTNKPMSIKGYTNLYLSKGHSKEFSKRMAILDYRQNSPKTKNRKPRWTKHRKLVAAITRNRTCK